MRNIGHFDSIINDDRDNINDDAQTEKAERQKRQKTLFRFRWSVLVKTSFASVVAVKSSKKLKENN